MAGSPEVPISAQMTLATNVEKDQPPQASLQAQVCPGQLTGIQGPSLRLRPPL